MSLGTFREQCIYPHTIKNLQDADIETLDKKLHAYLKLVHMEHLLNDYAFDSLGSWSDIFSGGRTTANWFCAGSLSSPTILHNG